MAPKALEKHVRPALGLTAVVAAVLVVGAAVPVGGIIEAENACYVRLPDLPARRYAGFGGCNPGSRVLAFAGGAAKVSAQNEEVFYEL